MIITRRNPLAEDDEEPSENPEPGGQGVEPQDDERRNEGEATCRS